MKLKEDLLVERNGDINIIPAGTLIKEYFSAQPYSRGEGDVDVDEYVFEVNGVMYTATVSAGDVDSFDIDFGAKVDGSEEYTFTDTIDKVDPTDVIATVMKIALDHFNNIGEPVAQYHASPMGEEGREENRRFKLYKRGAEKLIDKGFSPYHIDIEDYGGQSGLTFTIYRNTPHQPTTP
jgi:hypothetical protein